MKKYFKKLSLFVALSTTLLASCDSLNLTPEDYFTEGNFWKNEAQFQAYMYGMHNQLRNNYWNFWVLGEARSGAQKTGSGSVGTSTLDNTAICANNLTESSPGYSNWVGFYRPIFDLNLFIEKAEAASDEALTATSKNRFLAQAYSMRALYYFQLLKTYGVPGTKYGVPITLEPEVTSGDPDVTLYYLARSTYDQTMDQIKADVTKGEQLFETAAYPATGSGRELWNKAATKVLKADVFMWSAKVGKVAPYSQSELNTALSALNDLPAASFDLMDKFLDVFSYANKGNKEIIMALNFSTTTGGSNIPNQFVYAANDISSMGISDAAGKKMPSDTLNLIRAGWQRQEYTWAFFEAYDDTDSRKRGNFMDIYRFNTNGTIAAKGTVVRKYLGTVDNGVRKFVDDFVLYRYADVLLMKAEIKNALGQDPSDEINAVRKRAYGTTYPVYTSSDFETNELAIFQEKAKELALEGKMWHDLVRMKQANGDPLVFSAAASFKDDGSAVLNKATQSYMLVWPIDKSTQTTNPLIEQNPGYKVY